jgi:hypothetical protein
MGHPDGAQTHGSGGSGAGTAVLVVLAAALAVKLAGPVLAAVAELLHVFLIMAGVVVGLGAVGLVGLLTWRWRRWQKDAARAMPPYAPRMARAAQPLPEPPPAIEQHVHFHGLSAEDVAAILNRQKEDGSCMGKNGRYARLPSHTGPLPGFANRSTPARFSLSRDRRTGSAQGTRWRLLSRHARHGCAPAPRL